MTRTVDERAQRAIILLLLDDDHDPMWSRPELESKLGDIEPITVCNAVTALADAGVVRIDGEDVCATPASRHLDALELIGI